MILTVILIGFSGCFLNESPSSKVEILMNRYIKNDQEIMDELDMYLSEQNLTETQMNRYKEIIKNEYSTIDYRIKDERIDGNNATVEMSLKVKDLFGASKRASEYLIHNAAEFYTDGRYDESKFKDYKLKVMEETDDTIEYTVTIALVNEDGIWTIRDIDEDTLEKIHGIYDYETV